jgi:superoxide dismutase
MKETSEIHINNIRTHYEQHHQDLVDNFEKRLSDKRELIESYKEQIKVLSEGENKQINDLKKANLIKNIIISIFVCGVIALFVMELLHPEHGWLRY